MQGCPTLSDEYRLQVLVVPTEPIRVFDVRKPGSIPWEIQAPAGPLPFHVWMYLACYVDSSRCLAASLRGLRCLYNVVCAAPMELMARGFDQYIVSPLNPMVYPTSGRLSFVLKHMREVCESEGGEEPRED